MTKPDRRFVAVLLGLMLCLVLAGCSQSVEKERPAAAETDSRKMKVFTTIYPLYDFVKNVGREKVEVSYLVPPGTEPHEWEPSPKDLAELQKADVFIYCGAGMEGWIDKALKAIAAPKLVVVDSSQNIQLISGNDEEDSHDEHGEQTAPDRDGKGKHNKEEKPGQEHSHSAGTDPHIWVDPLNAVTMVENITAGLVKADPSNKEFYEANGVEYRKKLEALNEEYKSGLANATRKEFVTSHAAFGYLAGRYGLVQVPIRGLSPEVEPTPTRMAEVVKMAREKEIRYIFFESLVSPKISQVIATEIGAETLVLNPVDGLSQEELKAGKDYLSVMRENLVNLQKALEVKP